MERPAMPMPWRIYLPHGQRWDVTGVLGILGRERTLLYPLVRLTEDCTVRVVWRQVSGPKGEDTLAVGRDLLAALARQRRTPAPDEEVAFDLAAGAEIGLDARALIVTRAPAPRLIGYHPRHLPQGRHLSEVERWLGRHPEWPGVTEVDGA